VVLDFLKNCSNLID